MVNASGPFFGHCRFGLGPRPGDLKQNSTTSLDAIRAELDKAGREAHRDAISHDSVIAIGSALKMRALARNKDSLRRRIAATNLINARSIDSAATATAGDARSDSMNVISDQLKIATDYYRHLIEIETTFRTKQAMLAEVGFVERLIWFWSNHFSVSIYKSKSVRVGAGAFEREVIRPNVLGRFSDMLVAASLHPCMLLYLDNASSMGPTSKVGIEKQRGLNENLGREILELHTLGASGGYSQADVTNLARILTGWTVVRPASPLEQLGAVGAAVFNPDWHEPGEIEFLGENYPDSGAEQGHVALLYLARHPSTAQHVATKLARHFVDDVPPASLVKKLAATFLETDGDLRAVAYALIEAPEAWSADCRKLRSPQEFVIAALRLCGTGRKEDVVAKPLTALGQPFWGALQPNGFQDTVDTWGTPDGIKTRVDVAVQIARRADGDPRALLDQAFGDAVSAETRQSVLQAESRTQAVALLLMAPEFQWR